MLKTVTLSLFYVISDQTHKLLIIKRLMLILKTFQGAVKHLHDIFFEKNWWK